MTITGNWGGGRDGYVLGIVWLFIVGYPYSWMEVFDGL